MKNFTPSQGDFRHSIAFRYLSVTLATVLLVGFILGSILVYSSYRDQMASTQHHVDSQAKFLGAVMPEAVYSGDFLTLETLMRQTTEDPMIVYSVVLNNDGTPLTRYVNTEDALIAQALSQEDSTASVDILGILAIVDKDSAMRASTQPILSNGVSLGQIKIGYSVRGIWDNVRRVSASILISALALCLLFGVLTATLFRIQVGRPLQEVTVLAQALAAGNLDRRAMVVSRSRPDNELDKLKRAFNSMADQLQETLDGLRLSQKQTEKLSMVASRTDNMAIISDAKGRIEWVNDGFIRITGYTLEEVKGRTPGSLLQGPETDPDTVDYMRSQLAANRGFTSEVVNYSKSGRPYWVAVEVQPVRDEHGTLTNFMALESDITARKSNEKKLREAKEEAEMANKAKSIFLANMSHELRTPLNAIIGYSELLLEDAEMEKNPEAADDLGRIQGAGKHLLALISDILDLSKIEAGRMEIFLESFALSDMVESVSATTRSLVQKNRNKLIVETSPIAGPMISDATKLRQILFNLLSNAAKFTENGTITVDISQLSAGEAELELAADQHELISSAYTDPELVKAMPGTSWIRFCITDTGIGISADQLRTIFTAFDQGDPSTTRKYGGTGLGLAIVHRFCHLLGGAVMVESTLGQGTTFRVWLPQALELLPQEESIETTNQAGQSA